MNNTQQPSPDTIATIALELTKAIANTDNSSINTPKNREPKDFYFELYTECYEYVKKTLAS